MSVQNDKFSLVAGDYLSSGVPLRLNLEQAWPIHIFWKEGKWEMVPCTGFNVFKLMQVAEEKGYKSPYWVSLRDGENAGGELREDAEGVNVAGWRVRGVSANFHGDLSLDSVEDAEAKMDAAEDEETALPGVAMRPKVLFNTEAWRGVDFPAYVERQLPGKEEALERAQAIAEKGAGCEVKHGGVLAYYNPSLNVICLPTPEEYGSLKAYYWALFEQIGHALASRHQMDLFKGLTMAPFCKEASFKVLYAKMVAAQLAYEAGIDVLE